MAFPKSLGLNRSKASKNKSPNSENPISAFIWLSRTIGTWWDWFRTKEAWGLQSRKAKADQEGSRLPQKGLSKKRRFENAFAEKICRKFPYVRGMPPLPAFEKSAQKAFQTGRGTIHKTSATTSGRRNPNIWKGKKMMFGLATLKVWPQIQVHIRVFMARHFVLSQRHWESFTTWIIMALPTIMRWNMEVRPIMRQCKP